MESALPSPRFVKCFILMRSYTDYHSTPASARPTAVQVQGRASQAVSGSRSSERPAADYGEGLPSYSMPDYASYMNAPPNSIYNLSSGTTANEGMLYGPSSHLNPYYTLPHVDMPPDLGGLGKALGGLGSVAGKAASVLGKISGMVQKGMSALTGPVKGLVGKMLDKLPFGIGQLAKPFANKFIDNGLSMLATLQF